MLDSYKPESGLISELDEGMIMAMMERESVFGRFDSARLSTMGRYVELVPRLVPRLAAEPVKAPVLFIQCEEPFSPVPEDAPPHVRDWQAKPWDARDEVRTVGANHFSILENGAELTARAIEDWLQAPL
jgi:pimeloyl-ACP methyl ester carboxylesterase